LTCCVAEVIANHYENTN